MPKSKMDDPSLIFRHRAYTPIEFNPSINLIEENVYLGDLAAATNDNLLDSLGIRRILTLDIKPLPASIREKYTCLFIFALDQEDADLLTHFEECIRFIMDTKPSEKILVHCYFGVSRSATVMVAYVMRKHRLAPEEALDLVKAQRRLVFPNSGFIAQLHLFFLMNWQLDDNNLQYRLYKLYNAAKKVQKDKQFVVAVNSSLGDEITQSQLHYKCKKCRKPLFSEKSVFPHDVGRTLHWNVDSCTLTNPICSKGLLIRPLPWMQEAKEGTAGKLNCPHCAAKIGSFDWHGSKCPCGARMEPTFYISAEKVDEVPPN